MIDPELLSRMPLFAGLSDEELEALSDSFRRRRLARGATVFHYEDPGDACYIIEAGRVRIGLTSPEGKEIFLNVPARLAYENKNLPAQGIDYSPLIGHDMHIGG